jgi:hypothetical protein
VEYKEVGHSSEGVRYSKGQDLAIHDCHDRSDGRGPSSITSPWMIKWVVVNVV